MVGYGPGTKGNFSTFYPTPEAAARALWTWAGADWQARVLQKEMPQHRQDPQQAAPDPDMSLPLNEAEEEIIRVLRWTSRKNRKSRGKKNEYFQFTYKKSFGPGGKRNQSLWYPSKAVAARALYMWAKDAWQQRALTTEAFLPKQIGIAGTCFSCSKTSPSPQFLLLPL